MSVVVPFFDDERNCAVEQFVCLQRLIKLDASAVFEKLNHVLVNIFITNWSSVIPVFLDRASAMSSYKTGVQIKCKAQKNEIIYVQCYTHCLNLVLVDAYTLSVVNKEIYNLFGVIQPLYSFMEGSTLQVNTVQC